ncbi:MAG: hypothetical protein K9H49_16265 [Bacteroidales bacterium]|nr:hypothetical protein [Bacteroidales bacterium]
MIQSLNKYSILVVLFSTLILLNAEAQYYGLFFRSSNSIAPQRTGLDLSENGFLKFNNEFEISFDLMMRAERNFDFGYILRIVGSDGNNIDIIYDQFTTSKNTILVTCGQKFSSISLNIEETGIIDQWRTLTVRVDLKKDILELSLGDASFIETDIGLKSEREFKFLFGSNKFAQFETTHVPPMIIRDICIKSNKKKINHWPLQEYSGNFAKDKLKGKRARVYNPVWLNMKHMKWELERKIQVNGSSSILISHEKDSLILLSDAEYITISLNNNNLKIKKLSEPIPYVKEGGRLFHIQDNKKYMLVNAGNGRIIDFDPVELTFKEKHAAIFPNSSNWHYNIFQDMDSESILVFGGFEGSKYNNKLSRYNQINNRWENPVIRGRNLPPRYLAALGVSNSNDSLFILGGYGSETGSPILNPHFYSDLYSYSIKDSSFSKIFEYGSGFGSRAFANSLIIDSAESCFYALQFSPYSHESSLQLVKGSITRPEWNLMADKIPYNFKMGHSYADLFYSIKFQKLFAFTTAYNDSTNISDVCIYSLFYPPGVTYEKVQSDNTRKKMWIWIILIISVDIILIMYIAIRKKIIGKTNRRKNFTPSIPETGFFSTDLLKNTWESKSTESGKAIPEKRIYLFGGFRLHLNEEQEISNKFSPILKELFLLILLNSSASSNGVSNKILLEQVWGDMSLKNAKNNLSVNINKLRTILGPELSIMLKNVSGFWKFDLEGMEHIIFCDYWECWKILRSENRNTEEQISNLIQLIHRGGLLLNTSYEWLDSIKAKISHQIIDLLVDFSSEKGAKSDPDFAIKIADTIFLFDMINEQAMELKCKALVQLGKHSMSKDVYTKFSKEYLILYDVAYERSLKEIIES